MNLIIPNNIFATLFALSIPENERPNLVVKESSLITNELNSDENAIALIPSFDLIKNKELFVSSKLGIGFEELLSNSYLYFSPLDNKIDKILLRGDISANEVILSKIVLKELYNIQHEILLDTNTELNDDNNYLVTGNQNWESNLYERGMSFNEQVSDLIDYPYLNFLFVSKSESAIKKFNKNCEKTAIQISTNIDDLLNTINLGESLNEFIKKDFSSIYYDLTINETDGLHELFKLTYYHQILDDMFDIKFV